MYYDILTKLTEKVREKLKIISISPLKAQKKVETLRDIITMQVACQLEYTNESDKTINQFNILLREVMKMS